MNALVWSGVGTVLGLVGLTKAVGRLQLSKAKHPSLRGHARMGKLVASLVPYYAYPEAEIFGVDGAAAGVVAQRRAGFDRLATKFQELFPKTIAASRAAKSGISDLQFTSTYRVPFQFSRYVNERLPMGAFVESTEGVTVRDLDGNVFYDLTGAYGVNVFGSSFYKECMAAGSERVKDLGLVLGLYHPVVAENVERLRAISGMNQVSFHMSGTEAVMQAVRLARYHTRRRYLVRFCGAYHGWWGDVQPGVGNPQRARDTFTIKEVDDDSLRVLRRRRDIACVLVNPLQAMHPNAGAPTDGMMVDSSRRASFDKEAYAEWLRKLREVCTDRGIALIFDEVFVGFRLARGGAQEFFGVDADLVVYGKTLGGGFPIGAVCGKATWMRRFRATRPADVCFARGTFNSHPVVMGAMNEFLRRLDGVAHLYGEEHWNDRRERLNERLWTEGLPIEAQNLHSIWTLSYTRPGCYNWLLQHYLRAAGVMLSWVGTGRLIFSLDWSERDFDAVCEKIVGAARQMRDDGFFAADPALTDAGIRRRILRETIRHAV